MVFGKRRFRSLVSFRSLLELVFGAFLVLLWPFWRASCGSFTCHGSLKNLGCSMFFTSFWCFGVPWWRLECVSCVVSSIFRVLEAKQRPSEAFRRPLAAISEAKNLQQPLKTQGFLKVFGMAPMAPPRHPKPPQDFH